MAAATGQRFSNGSLNGASQQFHLHGQANSRKYPGAHHHHLMHGLLGGDDDDTDGATEQFPPFDPTHDGSEEDENMITGNSSDDEYRHFSTTTTATRRAVNGNGVGESLGVEQEAGGKEGSYGDAQHLQQHDGGKLVVEEDEQEEEEQSHTPMSNVDPVPEVEPNHDAKHNDQPQLHNDDASSNTQTSTTMLSPVTSPPYWAINHAEPLNLGPSASSSHDPFNHSNHSAESLIPGAITLQDNEAEEDEASQNAVGDYHGRHGEPQRQRTEGETRTSYGRDRNKACWAKSVEVTNYVIVNGSATNIGAFVVWNIRVQTLSGPYMNIRKRYSEFDDFRHRLIQTFPNFEAAVPVLPPKSVIAKFRPRFLEKRRAGLQYFLNCILLNPEFSGSPVLKDFLFS